MPNKTVWWDCERCGAQVAISSLVFMPLKGSVIPSRRFYYGHLQGEVLETALLISGDDGLGLAMEKPNYCPYCGVKQAGGTDAKHN